VNVVSLEDAASDADGPLRTGNQQAFFVGSRLTRRIGGCIADEMFELMEDVNKRLAARNDSSWPSNRARALTKARDVGFFLGMTVLNPQP
jgi:hypothetical protein